MPPQPPPSSGSTWPTTPNPRSTSATSSYGFTIDVLADYRPTGKGRLERQVLIVRDHVLGGRSFDSVEESDAAFAAWLPIRRAHSQTHRTHGQVIGVRADADRAALRPLPTTPYLVADRHLRRVGKDALISFEASLYSVPARRVRPGQRVELRVTHDLVAIHALTADAAAEVAAQNGEGALLAVHPWAARRGAWMVDEAHWEGLPDGARGPPSSIHRRTKRRAVAPSRTNRTRWRRCWPTTPAAAAAVARRPLAVYEALAGLPDRRVIR